MEAKKKKEMGEKNEMSCSKIPEYASQLIMVAHRGDACYYSDNPLDAYSLCE
jgi:hypothetical protein